MPAIILKIFEFVKKNFPISDAVEPKVIKTKEKPKVKKIVLTTIKFLFSTFILLNDVPELTPPTPIIGILFDKFLLFSKNFRKYMLVITRVGGTILLLTGVAILTDQLQILGFFILEYFPLFENIG